MQRDGIGAAQDFEEPIRIRGVENWGDGDAQVEHGFVHQERGVGNDGEEAISCFRAEGDKENAFGTVQLGAGRSTDWG